MHDDYDSDTQITGVLYPNTVERRRFIALYKPFIPGHARVILLGRAGQEQMDVWLDAQAATQPHEWADIRVHSYSAARRLYGPLVRSYMRVLEARQAAS